MLALIFGLPFLAVNNGLVHPDLDTFVQRIYNLQQSNIHKALASEYRSEMERNEHLLDSIDLHYKMVNAYRQYFLERVANTPKEHIGLLAPDVEALVIQRFYEDRRIASDFKNTFLGLHFVNTGRLPRAKRILNQVKNPELKYYNYSLGRFYRRSQKPDSAIFFLEWEIEFNGYETGALKELSALYFQNGLYLPLRELVFKDTEKAIHFYFRRLVFFIEKDIPRYFGSLVQYEWSKVNPLGTSAAFLIAFIWLIYVRKLDIFEPERWRYVLLAFVLGAIFVEFVYPLTDVLNIYLAFDLNGAPLNDFMYCFIGIGMVEELVKAIPLLIIVLFTKQADEPYDFILYASSAALGFAFLENISYLEAGELKNINGRMLTAAVAHMSFSSAVAYGVLISKFVIKRFKTLTILGFFILASLAHGFYDFWLINDWASKYSGFTIIFFIGTVHLWFIMKNNAINISNYFDSSIKLNNDQLKNYLIVSLVFVLMYSFIGISYTKGQYAANNFLYAQILSYPYFILHLSYSFSRFDVERGYLAPFRIPFDFMIPRLKETPNYSGTKLAIGLFELNPRLTNSPRHKLLRGELSQRKTVDGNKHWYLFESDYPINWNGHPYRYFLIKHHDRSVALNSGRKCLIQVMAAKKEGLIDEAFLEKKSLDWISWGVAKARLTR